MVLTALVAAGAGVSGVGAGTYLTWNRRLGKTCFFVNFRLHVDMTILFYYKKYMESMENPLKRLSKVSQTVYSEKDCGSLARFYQQVARWISVPWFEMAIGSTRPNRPKETN